MTVNTTMLGVAVLAIAAWPAAGPKILLKVLQDVGPMLIPLAASSILLMALTLERLLALRWKVLIPRELASEARRLGKKNAVPDPDKIAQLARKYPSMLGRL